MQPRILYPARLSFRIEVEIKVFPDKQKLKEFITTKPALQEIPVERQVLKVQWWENYKVGAKTLQEPKHRSPGSGLFYFSNCLITASTYNIVFGILTGHAPAVYSILGHEYIWRQTKHSYPRPGAHMMSFWRERAVTAAFCPGNETGFSFLAALSLSFRTFLQCLQLLVLQCLPLFVCIQWTVGDIA